MRTSSAAVLLVLLCGFVFAPAAVAQMPVVFRGSTLRTAFGAGVLVSATTDSRGEERLRINATSDTAQPFLKKRLPVDPRESPNPFAIKIGPDDLDKPECRWGGGPKTLNACFATGKATELAPGHQLVVLWRLPDEDLAAVLVRGAGVVPGYARCTVLMSSRQLAPRCTLYFEQGGEWHEVDTSSLAVDNMKLFQCSALELRNAVWPGAPRLPDGCRS